MGRPRTTNAKLKDFPRGMRKVGSNYYWRGTDHTTKAVETALKARGVAMQCGDSPIKARRWWEKNVSPLMMALLPADHIQGTVEELLRRYESEELPTIKNAKTNTAYAASIQVLRQHFGARRYAKSDAEAFSPSMLRPSDVNLWLKKSADRQNAANKDISLLGRVFRLARTHWGLTSFNPVENIEYPSQPPRDNYIDDATFLKMREAAGPVLRCMMDISSQTGARRGMIFDIRLGDIKPDHLVMRVSKKKTRTGFEVVNYAMTPDLRAALDSALALRAEKKGAHSTQKSGGSAHLFLTRNGTPYNGENFKTLWKTVRDKLGIEAWSATFHDIRAKAASDSDSDQSAQKLLAHADANITRRVYRRKAATVQPIPGVRA